MPKQTKSIEQLRHELAVRESELARLQSQRERLAKELAKVDARIEGLMGTAKATRGRRGRKPKMQKVGRGRRGRKPGKKIGRGQREKPLSQYIAEVLKKAKEGMGTQAIAEAVQAAGYKTSSKKFYYSVANVLNKDPRFTRVSPGTYKLA